MPNPEIKSLLKHYNEFFKGHSTEVVSWDRGPILKVIPEFKVFVAKPGPKINLWSYCSIGASTVHHPDHGLLEFIVHSPIESPRMVETLAMLSYYHNDHCLGFGHTVPIGEPWLDNSKCDNWLLSKPYPLGPDLEICKHLDSHIHITWLLPITVQEKNYKVSNGMEALEQLFEDKGLEFWSPNRPSLV